MHTYFACRYRAKYNTKFRILRPKDTDDGTKYTLKFSLMSFHKAVKKKNSIIYFGFPRPRFCQHLIYYSGRILTILKRQFTLETSWSYLTQNFARNSMVVVIFVKNVRLKNGGHFKIRPPYSFFVALYFFSLALYSFFVAFHILFS